ncbi:MAG TPA: hypothetical protein VLA04_00745 [Verrucomicrobiae bacterium]|nr:hypothetical protein [Verrucomicrobiae bacterium]
METKPKPTLEERIDDRFAFVIAQIEQTREELRGDVAGLKLDVSKVKADVLHLTHRVEQNHVSYTQVRTALHRSAEHMAAL